MTDVIWENTVDGGKFRVEVKGHADRTGVLKVTVAETNETLLNENVPLSYGAVFGPDVSDVEEWKTKAITVIDKWIEARASANGNLKG